MKPDATRARAEELAEVLCAIGPVTTGRFFGGAALRLSGLQFGFVMKGALYLHRGAAPPGLNPPPFRYTAQGREVTVSRYVLVPEAIEDDLESLIQWARRAHHAAAAGR